MKKFYKIILFLSVLIFLSTYNSKDSDIILKKNTSLFNVKNIEIKNNLLIETSEIKKKLSNLYKKNIFFINESQISDPLKKINFLEKIEVKKRYPDTIIVKIFETKPLGIIFEEKNKYILDSSSNLIPFNDSFNFTKLPNIFGEESRENFVDFSNKLKKNNFPHEKIKNFYYFQIGRWNLQLLNNKVIKLPHKNIDESIKKSIELLSREDFKNYNIIDLRVDGKIIVE